MIAVNTIKAATLPCLKKRSTMYLSKCVEAAQSIGAEKAKTATCCRLLPSRALIGFVHARALI